MRRSIWITLWILAHLLPSLAHAQISVQIEEVGLQDHFTSNLPTPVRIHLSPPPKSQTILLELTIRPGSSPRRRLNELRTDYFRKRIQSVAGQPLDFDFPVMLSEYDSRELVVAAKDLEGHEIGRTSRGLGSLVLVDRPQALVAIYCQSTQPCQAAQSQIFFAEGEQADPKKAKNFKILILRELRREWWCYGAVRTMVLAGPISRLPQEQLTALEFYVRGGGNLVLLESEIADIRFLAPYRQNAGRSGSVRVGRGHLLRVPDLKGHKLNKLFQGIGVNNLVEEIRSLVPNSAAQSLLSRVGVSFSFPKLRWLLILLALYIVVVGPLNFTVLRRVRRLEWGWFTVTTLALGFALGTYLLSSLRRPHDFTLDNVAVYWMDGGSSVAALDLGLRVSSPARQSVAISVLDDFQPFQPRFYNRDSSALEMGSEITEKRRFEVGWDTDLGPPTAIHIPMFQWSIRDLELEGFRTFPGTVHWIAPMRLRNDTGQTFRQALYLDLRSNQQRTLPVIGPGEEIDLGAMGSKAIWQNDRSQIDVAGMQGLHIQRPGPKDPLNIADLPYSGFPFGNAGQVFVGLGSQPVASAKLDIPGTKASALDLFVVSLDQP